MGRMVEKRNESCRVFVLSPGSEEWGSHLGDSQMFLEELRACVRIVLKDWDEKSDIEIKNITYMWPAPDLSKKNHRPLGGNNFCVECPLAKSRSWAPESVSDRQDES